MPEITMSRPLAPTSQDDFLAQIKAYFDSQNKSYSDTIARYQNDISTGAGGQGEGFKASRRSQIGDLNNYIDKMKENYDPLVAAIQSGALDSSQINLAKKYLSGDAIAGQQFDELLAMKKQLSEQDAKLADFRGQMEDKWFGGQGLTLGEALVSTGGDLASLNRFLGDQQSATFKRDLAPVINMSLGAHGLDESGANVELQSQAYAQLEQQRQAQMMQASLGARGQLEGMQRQDLLGGIGYAQQTQNNQFELARTGIAMNFQRELENQRAALARELSHYGGGAGGGGLGSMIGMGVGAIAGIPGGLAGMAMGAGIGGQLGGNIGGAISPGSSGYGAPSAGFFAAGSQLGNSWTRPSPSSYNQTQQPWYNAGSSYSGG